MDSGIYVPLSNLIVAGFVLVALVTSVVVLIGTGTVFTYIGQALKDWVWSFAELGYRLAAQWVEQRDRRIERLERRRRQRREYDSITPRSASTAETRAPAPAPPPPPAPRGRQSSRADLNPTELYSPGGPLRGNGRAPDTQVSAVPPPDLSSPGSLSVGDVAGDHVRNAAAAVTEVYGDTSDLIGPDDVGLLEEDDPSDATIPGSGGSVSLDFDDSSAMPRSNPPAPDRT